MSRRRTLLKWGCASTAALAVALVILVVVLAIIARDPTGIADRINYALSQVGNGAKAVLHAPIAFFQALVAFLDRLFQ